jgi:hypothetical protein
MLDVDRARGRRGERPRQSLLGRLRLDQIRPYPGERAGGAQSHRGPPGVAIPRLQQKHHHKRHAGRRTADGRRKKVITHTARRGRLRAAHRLRQHRQPAAGARRLAAQGDGDTPGARRPPPAAAATIVDRKPAARRFGRSRRVAAGTVGTGWFDALAASKLQRLLPTSGSVAARKRRSNRSVIHTPDIAADRRSLRPRPGVAGVESGCKRRIEGGGPRR